MPNNFLSVKDRSMSMGSHLNACLKPKRAILLPKKLHPKILQMKVKIIHRKFIIAMKHRSLQLLQ